MQRRLLVLLAASSTCFVQAVSAQNLAPMDEQVIAKVHQANQMEIQIGKLAEQKGASAGVKRYGGLLRRDHQKGDQLVTKSPTRRV